MAKNQQFEDLEAQLAAAKAEVADHITARKAAEGDAAAAKAEVVRLTDAHNELLDKHETLQVHADAEIERLKRARGAGPAGLKAGELAPEHKGKRTYRLTQPCFRRGEYLTAGSMITVVDEKPSRTWVPVDDSAPAPKAATAASPVDVQT